MHSRSMEPGGSVMGRHFVGLGGGGRQVTEFAQALLASPDPGREDVDFPLLAHDDVAQLLQAALQVGDLEFEGLDVVCIGHGGSARPGRRGRPDAAEEGQAPDSGGPLVWFHIQRQICQVPPALRWYSAIHLPTVDSTGGSVATMVSRRQLP